ncbi:MAG TPA: energy transducer TonB [Candidatus Angelobacter sp.]|nr:energy transducer TonB [Candidatus Angelobacter sp.]
MEAQRGAAENSDQTAKAPSAPELHLHLLDEDLSEDVVSSYRRREAAWISLITHGIIITLLLLIPKWTKDHPVVVAIKEPKSTIFLDLPSDQQKIKTPPPTDVISDRNRIAQTNKPAVDKDFLRKLLNARKPGAPKAAEPPPQQAMQQPPATAAAPPQATQNAQLQAPQPNTPKKSPFTIASPGATVNQAVQSVASGHGAGVEYGGGEYGSVVHPRTDRRDAMEILSDTLGVDFGPYMKRLHYTVQNHWDPLIPVSALPPVMKKGVVVIEFSITKDGKVEGMKLISSSGDVSLDRAAWGAITDAIPLPNLPNQFTGEFLTIRAHFYYNPDKADLQ